MWLEDKDVLVLAKKNKQDPTQVQFPGDWLMVSSVIGAAVCLWICGSIQYVQYLCGYLPLRV